MKRNIYLILLFMTLAGFSANSNRNIHGTVYFATGNKPATGVVVEVKGSAAKTISDQNGHYSISVPEESTALTFKYPGCRTREVKIGKADRIDVQLYEDESTLNDVVIVAKQSRVRRDITSSVSTVSANAQQEYQLRGKVAGIAVTQSAPGSESYNGIVENQFNNPLTTALSTFAVDVDAASYSNLRRFINSGQLPPKDAVRIEEMINYFNYDLKGPANGAPVAINTELSEAPWNHQHRLLRIGLKAKMVETDKLPSSNLVFLIDVSGSMQGGNRLPLVKSSLKLLVDQLRDKDHVAIVTYAGAAGLRLESTPGSQKSKIKEAIETLEAGGSTAGGAGLKLAYRIATENFIKKGNNRIVMASDGDFNVGNSSDEDMEKLIVNYQQSGISISVFGFGMGNLKDSKMETIADKGHGNYAYIDNISEARKAMVTEFGGTLFTVAKDVKLQIEFNPAKVQAYRLLGYENRLLDKEDFNNDRKIGGDMGVGHTVTALYEIIPAGLKDDFTNHVDPLKYQKNDRPQPAGGSSEMVTIKFRYKSPDSNKSKMEQVAISDFPKQLTATTNDFRFATAVAELGLLLRDSPFKQKADFSSLIARAKAAKGSDENGYRAEFIGMAENAQLLWQGNAAVMNEK